MEYLGKLEDKMKLISDNSVRMIFVDFPFNSTQATWDTGHWDGKKTDPLLVQDEKGDYHVAEYYEFPHGDTEWYDEHDFTFRYKIVRWMEIPKY